MLYYLDASRRKLLCNAIAMLSVEKKWVPSWRMASIENVIDARKLSRNIAISVHIERNTILPASLPRDCSRPKVFL
jgi:hypothetical protein